MKVDLAVAAPQTVAISRSSSFAAFLRDSVSRDRLYSWSDQAVVSIANFSALIVLARWSGASQVGIYAVGFTVLAVLLAVQESLITRPYTIQLHQPEGSAAEHAFASVMLSALLSVASAVALGVCAFILSRTGSDDALTMVTLTLAAIIPCVLMREFARRFSFAHFKFLHALLLDIVTAALNVAILIGLAAANWLTAATAFAALGLSCGIGALGWLYCARHDFKPSYRHLWTVLKRSGSLGKWVLSGHLATQTQGYTTHWLSMSIVGAGATGAYAACLSIVALANPLLFGFLNILTPRLVRTFHAEGLLHLKQHAARDTLLLAALMSLFCIFVAVIGDRAMQLFYPGPEYQGHLHMLNVLALAALASAVGAPAYSALISMRRASAAASVAGFSSLLSLAVIWWSLTHWGLLGAAYGMLVVEVVGSIARWILFLMMPEPQHLNRAAA